MFVRFSFFCSSFIHHSALSSRRTRGSGGGSSRERVSYSYHTTSDDDARYIMDVCHGSRDPTVLVWICREAGGDGIVPTCCREVCIHTCGTYYTVHAACLGHPDLTLTTSLLCVLHGANALLVEPISGGGNVAARDETLVCCFYQ